jgi:hypothetical protein
MDMHFEMAIVCQIKQSIIREKVINKNHFKKLDNN